MVSDEQFFKSFREKILGVVEEVPMVMQQDENAEGKEDANAQPSSQRLDF